MVILAFFDNVMRAFKTAHEIFTEAVELQRAMQKRYPHL
jgi:hypothetical protein